MWGRTFEEREILRKKFPKGTKVKAVLYDLRHKGIWEPQICTVVKCSTEEDIKNGHRFNVMVQYGSDDDYDWYCVFPDDVEVL